MALSPSLVSLPLALPVAFRPRGIVRKQPASSSPDAPRAIAARYPGTPADTPDRWRPSADGNRYGVAAGRPGRRKPPEQAETWMAEMKAGNIRRPVLP